MCATLWAIPGFLGLPSDWNFFPEIDLRGIDLNAFPWESLEEWGRKFNCWVTSQGTKENIVIGYSLGGRLALHALNDRPGLWNAAIIISAHSGLLTEADKKERCDSDQRWADKFRKDNWTSLMSSWNQQKIFAHDPFQFDRCEENYSREQLANTLVNGSLGRQENLRDKIAQLQLPILWMNGSKDFKFLEIADQVQLLNFKSQKSVIANAGHRAPWTHPQFFCEEINQFLKKL